MEEKRIFSLTSQKFEGEVLFEFTNEKLSKFDMSGAELDDRQHAVMIQILPRTVAELHEWAKKLQKESFTEIPNEVTFDQFWRRYFQGRTADNSSKKRAELKFSKMTKTEQLKAFGYIGKYLARIAPGTNPKHAETYLNSEIWNN